jgi:uncharacterized protein (DUF58 family)
MTKARRFGTPNLTRRGFGTLFVGMGATGAGTALGVAEATTTGLLMLALWVVAGVHVIIRCGLRPTVTVQRVIAGDSHLPLVGQDLTVDTFVVAHQRSGIGEITEVAVDDLSVRRGARSVRMAVRPLRGGEHASVSYRVTLRERGTLRFLTSTWRRQDPLGLFRWAYQLGEPSEVTVGPAVIDLGVDGTRLIEALRPHGGTRRKVGTDPFELRELRPYVTGDDLRRVHWASSARRNELIVREPETITARQTLPLRIIVDARTSEHRGTLELALSVAASVIVIAELPLLVTIATDEELREHMTADSALAALAAVPRERASRKRAPRSSAATNVPAAETAEIAIVGPGSSARRASGRAVLAAGSAPLDASAWEPGDPTRAAVADAIVALLRAAAADEEPSTIEAAS